MQRILRIIQTNYVIAIIITIVAFLLYPSVNQYSWLYRADKSQGFSITFYLDIDKDGQSERLEISDNNTTFGSLSLYSSNDLLLSLTNLPYNIFIKASDNIIINRGGGNFVEDITFLGERNDSLFLIRTRFLNGKMGDLKIDTYFLDLIEKFKGKHRFGEKLRIADIDSDGEKEIVIMIASGYTILPRRMYVVNFIKNEVLKSPLSGIVFTDFDIVDFENDGQKEIIVNTVATCNLYDEFFVRKQNHNNFYDSVLVENKEVLLEYGDCSAWVLAFNNKLEYLFDPKPIEGWTGGVELEMFMYEGENALLSLYKNGKDSTLKPMLLIHNKEGELLEKQNIDDKNIGLYSSENEGFYQVYLQNEQGQIFEISDELEMNKYKGNQNALGSYSSIFSEILNQNLYVTIHKEDNLSIYNEDFDLLKEFNIAGIWKDYLHISSYKSGSQEVFMLDLGGSKIQLKMEENPYYIYQYIIWLVLYLLVWLSLNLIKRFYTQKSNSEKVKLELIVKKRTEEVNKQKSDLEDLASDLKEKNEEVYQQNSEIEQKRSEVEALYEGLSSGVASGKKIKDVLLPSEADVRNVLGDAFVHFRPKKVVGGDFFWVSQSDNRQIVIVGDAPGESISGGFLSLLIINLLSAIKLSEILTASEVLKQVNAAIHQNLSSYLVRDNDGVEMAVLIIDKDGEKNKINFASANIPLHYFESDKVLSFDTIEPNDYPIRAGVESLAFEDKIFELPKGSMLYLATKGLGSQIGGSELEPFSKHQLKTTLMRINVLPTEKQKQILVEKFDKWRAIQEQTDDVLCVGFRL